MAQHQQVATLPSDNFTSLQLPRRVQPHIFCRREEGGELLVPAFPLEVVTLPQGGTTDKHRPEFTLFLDVPLIGVDLKIRFKEIKKTKPPISE